MRKVLSLFAFVAVLIALSAVSASAQASCTPGVNHCANLSWTAPSTGPAPTGYNVYRSNTSGGCATVTASTCSKVGSVGVTSFNDGPLSPSTTYFWVVTSLANGQESGPSNQVTATTQPDPPPSAPSGLTVVAK